MTTPTLDEQEKFVRWVLGTDIDEDDRPKWNAIIASIRELKAIKESAQEEAGHEIGLWPMSAISAVAKLKAELAAIKSAEMPEPVGWMSVSRRDISLSRLYFGKDEEIVPIYGPELVSFALRMKAEAEANRVTHVSIPTNTMEQEFQAYYQRGYNAGYAAAIDKVMK